MAQKGYYFIVWSARKNNNYLTIEGRCGDTSIKIGNIFRYVYRYSEAQMIDGVLQRKRIFQRSTSLVVQRIEAYRKMLNELGPGMTAEIEVTGLIENSITKGDILGSFQGEKILKMY